MRKFFTIITVISFTIHSFQINASESITKNKSKKVNYSWDLQDNNQKKIACGMLVWGVFMSTMIVLLSGFSPSSTAPGSDTTKGKSDGKKLF